MASPEEVIGDLVREIQDSTDDLTGFVAGGDLIKLLQRGVEDIAKLRRAFARRLLVNYTMEEIAQASGITRSRVEAIVNKQ